MDKLKYKFWTWPENPETFLIDAVREPMYTIAEDGTISYQGLGPLCRIISGRGVFQGEEANNHKMMLEHYQQTKCLLVSYSDKPLGLF